MEYESAGKCGGIGTLCNVDVVKRNVLLPLYEMRFHLLTLGDDARHLLLISVKSWLIVAILDNVCSFEKLKRLFRSGKNKSVGRISLARLAF